MIFILLQAIENESDRVLLTDLYTQHQRLFLYKANMYTRNSSHAEDVLQDAMIRVIRKVDTLRGLTEAQMVAYVDRAIYSCAMTFLQKEAKTPQADEWEDALEGIQSETDVMDHLNRKELSIQLGIVLEQLAPRERNVLIYKYIFEYKDSEIARILSVKPESVRMILTRARRSLKQFMMKEEQHGLQYQETNGAI